MVSFENGPSGSFPATIRDSLRAAQDEGVREAQASAPRLGCGGVKGGGDEVRKGVLGGNQGVGGDDGAI